MEEEQDLFGESDREEPEHQESFEVEAEQLVEEASLPDPGYYFKLPEYIGVQETPFDPRTFEYIRDETELVKSEYTIRWRYSTTAQGQTFRESNSKLVKWSDGSMSLFIGNEPFKAQIDQQKSLDYLVHRFVGTSYFQSQRRIQQSIGFRPYSMNSAAHKKFNKALQLKHKKEAKAKMYAVKQDPEKMKMEAEKAELERLKAKRKLEAQRFQMEESLTVQGLEYEPIEDEYDDEDDFIDDEENESKINESKKDRFDYSSDSDIQVGNRQKILSDESE